nr:hypothetical protein [Enterocloster lavalensis]
MADPAEAVAADHIVVLKGVAAEQMAELGMEVITPKVGPAKGPQQEHGRLPPVHCIQEEVAEEVHHAATFPAEEVGQEAVETAGRVTIPQEVRQPQIREEEAEEGHIMKVTAITNARLEATVDLV